MVLLPIGHAGGATRPTTRIKYPEFTGAHKRLTSTVKSRNHSSKGLGDTSTHLRHSCAGSWATLIILSKVSNETDASHAPSPESPFPVTCSDTCRAKHVQRRSVLAFCCVVTFETPCKPSSSFMPLRCLSFRPVITKYSIDSSVKLEKALRNFGTEFGAVLSAYLRCFCFLHYGRSVSPSLFRSN